MEPFAISKCLLILLIEADRNSRFNHDEHVLDCVDHSRQHACLKLGHFFKRILVVFKISYAMMSKRCLMTFDFEHGVVWVY